MRNAHYSSSLSINYISLCQILLLNFGIVSVSIAIKLSWDLSFEIVALLDWIQFKGPCIIFI